MNISRILLGLLLIVGAGGAFATGTNAFFSDTELSTGNTFTAGAIDLKIDNDSYYNGVATSTTSWEMTDLTTQKFFDFGDLKPGDWGEDTISIHVETNDAWMCANVTLTSNDDNGINEPESEVDETDGAGNGELASLINFAWWADDGDNVFEEDEELLNPIGAIGSLTLGVPYPLALADSDENIWTGTGAPILGNTPYYIGKAWCFGVMGEAPLPQSDYTGPDADNDGEDGAGTPEDGGFTCDGAGLGNGSQTDSLTADISFEAMQARNNPNFQCEVPDVPPTITACANPDVEAWADSVVSHDQGKRKDGTPILASRIDPSKALGPAETAGNPSDIVPPGSTFYSLGFNVGTTSTRSITVAFDNVIWNQAGPDVRIYEVTGGVYPDESARVEASQDGIDWTTLTPDAIRDEDLELGALAWAKYIRITDLTPTAGFENEADGYDVDAIKALNCGVMAQ